MFQIEQSNAHQSRGHDTPMAQGSAEPIPPALRASSKDAIDKPGQHPADLIAERIVADEVRLHPAQASPGLPFTPLYASAHRFLPAAMARQNRSTGMHAVGARLR